MVYIDVFTGRCARSEKIQTVGLRLIIHVKIYDYHEREVIKNLLAANSIETIELLNQGYQEQDGSVTEDIFIFARKVGASV